MNDFVYDISVINTEDIDEVKKEYQNSKEWQNFAKNGTKNPFLKELLLKKYSNICQFCHAPIKKDNFVLHHLTYKNICSQPLISISSPTPKNPDRKINVPDCKLCKNVSECIEKFVPVHSYCSQILRKTAQIMRKEIK